MDTGQEYTAEEAEYMKLLDTLAFSGSIQGTGRRRHLLCMLHDALVMAILLFVTQGHNASPLLSASSVGTANQKIHRMNADLPVADAPFTSFLPTPTRQQPIWIISLTPDIVLLDVRWMAFSIADPVPDLRGDSLVAEAGEPRYNVLQHIGREIPRQHALE